MVDDMTEKQLFRQHIDHRQNGKYSITNPCELCGKSSGIDYYGLPDCNETGIGYCVCKKCAEAYESKLVANK